MIRFYPITHFLSQDIIESSYINLKFKFKEYRKDIYINRILTGLGKLIFFKIKLC